MPLCVQLYSIIGSQLPDPYRASSEQLRRPLAFDLPCSHTISRLSCTASNGGTAVSATGRLSQLTPSSSGHHRRSAIAICAATPGIRQLQTQTVAEAVTVTLSYTSSGEEEEQSATEAATGNSVDTGSSGSCHATNSNLPQQDTSRPAPEPGDLFEALHVVEWSLPLALYFPLGCALASFRMALWVLLLAVDQPWLCNNDTSIRVFLGLLGVRVAWHNAELIPAERHVLVSNHTTVGDLLVLYARPESYVHLVTARLPKRVTEACSPPLPGFSLRAFLHLYECWSGGHKASNHRVQLRHASGETYCGLAEAQETDPVHLFPEGGMTNGRGMMRFSRGFMRFGRGLPVVPFALRVRSAFDISTHTLSSSFLANLFWFSFSPWVELDATVLPPMYPTEGEGNGFFVKRVQAAIADELNVEVADLTQSQKQKLVAAAKQKSC